MANYELSDATPRRLLGFAAGVLLLVAFSALAMGWLHQAWRQPEGPLTTPTPLELGERDPAELHRYQWVDRSQGIVQIPIEEALQVVSQGGARASGATATPAVDGSAGGRAGPSFRAAPGSPTPAAIEPPR